MRLIRRGQVATEYAVLAVVIAGSLLAMAVYMKRGIAGRLRASADSLGEQYAPGRTDSDFTTRMSGQTTTTSVLKQKQQVDVDPITKEPIIGDVIETTTTITTPETTSRTGNEDVGALTQDLWSD